MFIFTDLTGPENVKKLKTKSNKKNYNNYYYLKK